MLGPLLIRVPQVAVLSGDRAVYTGKPTRDCGILP